jgi:hypothetical protein
MHKGFRAYKKGNIYKQFHEKIVQFLHKPLTSNKNAIDLYPMGAIERYSETISIGLSIEHSSNRKHET